MAVNRRPIVKSLVIVDSRSLISFLVNVLLQAAQSNSNYHQWNPQALLAASLPLRLISQITALISRDWQVTR